MKKITLLTLLMWSSLFYGQEYLNEGFEGVTFPPTGWIDQAGATDTAGNNWVSSTFTAHSGTKSAFFDDFSGTNDRWLISEAMDLTSAVNPVLTYYMYVRFPDFNATKTVHYSTDYDGTNFGTATWTQIDNITGAEADAAEDTWKIQGNFDLSAANGDNEVYIAFNYVGEDNSRWYLDDILVRELPTCVEPSEGSISGVTTSSAIFSWTSGPSGTETLWDVELVDITGGETQGTGTVSSTSSNPHTFMGLTTGNSYEAYVRADCGGGDKSTWIGPFAFATADDNDECTDAKLVVQDIETVDAASATVINGSIAGATDSGIAANCSGGNPNDDVWFAFVARTDGVNITIDTPFDGVIELFSTTDDTCGTLTYDSCADLALAGVEEISVTGLTAGDTYFVRVYQWDAAAPADGNFTIKIWSSETLSNNDVEDNTVEFRLYPNPVQDKLNLRAQDNIENVSIYNMLGQEVLRQAPNKNSSEVDMSALQAGSYFVKVTIDGVTETKQIIKR